MLILLVSHRLWHAICARFADRGVRRAPMVAILQVEKNLVRTWLAMYARFADGGVRCALIAGQENREEGSLALLACSGRS